MARAKRGFKARRRRNKVLKQAKGFVGSRKSLIRSAQEAVDHALVYSYRDRRVKKREARSLWQIRIGAAVQPLQISYSKFIGALKKAGVGLDRKVLSELAITEPADFAAITQCVQQAA